MRIDHLLWDDWNVEHIFIVLDHETTGGFYVVTARDMDESEKRSFNKMRGK